MFRSIGFIFLCLVFTPFITKGATLLEDDFESYTLNSWASRWNGLGINDVNRSDNCIEIDPTDSTNQVFRLTGVPGSSLEAGAYSQDNLFFYHYRDDWIHIDDYTRIDFRVYNGNESIPDSGHQERATIALGGNMRHFDVAYAGRIPSQPLLTFYKNGTISAGGNVLQTYTTQRWYDISIEYNEQRIRYQIDNVDKGAFSIEGDLISLLESLPPAISVDFDLELTAQAGSVLFDDVKVTSIPAPQKPEVISFPDPAPVTSASNVVYMVHGFTDSDEIFTTPRDSEDASLKNTNMKANIENALSGNSDWDVLTYDWSSDAEVKPQDLENGQAGQYIPSPRAKRAAEANGQILGKSILDNYNKASGRDGNVHLIGHSLGCRVISEAARYLNASPEWNGQVQLTFLDAYTPDGWEKTFGEEATWAEHYYHDQFGSILYYENTEDTLDHAYNVDITDLMDDNPLQVPTNNHKWPLRWYDRTIDGSAPEGSEGGFVTSIEYADIHECIWNPPAANGHIPKVSNMFNVVPEESLINTSDSGTIEASKAPG